MRYRKKPVEIEAFQYDGNILNAPEWAQQAWKNRKIITNTDSTNELVIETLEGDMLAHIGDYIIKGIKGELYPCKPDIFELTYEKVE